MNITRIRAGIVALSIGTIVAFGAGSLARSAADPVSTRTSFSPTATWAWTTDTNLGDTLTSAQYAQATIAGVTDADHNAGFRLRNASATNYILVAASKTQWKIEPTGGTFLTGPLAVAAVTSLRASISAANVVTITVNGAVVATRTVPGVFPGLGVVPAVWQSTPTVKMTAIEAGTLVAPTPTPTETSSSPTPTAVTTTPDGTPTVTVTVTAPPVTVTKTVTATVTSTATVTVTVTPGVTVTPTPTPTPTPTVTPVSGQFLLGASGTGVGNGALNLWQTNHAIRMVGTWSDGAGADFSNLTNEYGSWTGPIDVAVGGLRAGQNWTAAAAGSYNAEWQTRFNALKAAWGTRAPGNLHVRIAHEFNGDFSGWKVSDADAPRFVTAFRAWSKMLTDTIPGAVPVWSPNDGTSSMTHVNDAYPGSDRVGMIAVDSYNSYPHRTDLAAINASFSGTDGGNPVGVEAWRLYALSKGVPLYLGETGNPALDSGGGAGGGDAPAYFNAIEAWAEAHAGSDPGEVYAAIWFNIASGYPAHFQFFNGTSADSLQPNFAAAFRSAPVVG